ncbi:hypothetical protein [Paenibacillus hunanensis]|uniref:DUF1275 domain-containing protein n=1 Tax=Paenibacillus hunanensis TaxID=539262 RepID=A0ABU1IV67_9BACL|nr:hypothetical protein [Paenibacillus hunanensis]MDR6243118.1 hypothetical protein [Paenibacillus hunanensis]GGJ11715.1 hypothetical protein GCM10008022_21070 [Paenibacillus hunanensis]
MSVAVFIGLGILDVFAVFVLIFKLYRLPLFFDFVKIMYFCVFAAVVSYIIRIFLVMPWIDMPLLIIMMILFLRYILKMRVLYASLAISAGMNAYIIIQLMIAILFTNFISFDKTVFAQDLTAQSQIIQLTSIIVAYLVGLLLYKTNRGFSFIPVMPHEFSIKTKYSKHKAIMVVTVVGMIFLALAITLLLQLQIILLLPGSIIAFGLSYYFSKRKDIEL